MNLIPILDMGGYGIYIWTTYSITIIVFGIILVSTLQEMKRVRKIIKHYLSSL